MKGKNERGNSDFRFDDSGKSGEKKDDGKDGQRDQRIIGEDELHRRSEIEH